MKRILSVILVIFLMGCGGKFKKITLPFTDSKWELKGGIYEKKPILIRINRALEGYCGSLSYQAAACVSFKSPDANGMPDSIESAALKKIENSLVEKLDVAGLAVFALEVTTDTTCNFIFYTDKKKAVKTVLSDIARMFGAYHIDLTVKSDELWMNYKWFSSYASTGIWGGL
jgi:hypothetical protein